MLSVAGVVSGLSLLVAMAVWCSHGSQVIASGSGPRARSLQVRHFVNMEHSASLSHAPAENGALRRVPPKSVAMGGVRCVSI
jgi:hypothetical protein